MLLSNWVIPYTMKNWFLMYKVLIQNIKKFSYKRFLCKHILILSPYSILQGVKICCDLILTQNKNCGFTVGGVISEIIIFFKFSYIISGCFLFFLNFSGQIALTTFLYNCCHSKLHPQLRRSAWDRQLWSLIPYMLEDREREMQQLQFSTPPNVCQDSEEVLWKTPP